MGNSLLCNGCNGVQVESSSSTEVDKLQVVRERHMEFPIEGLSPSMPSKEAARGSGECLLFLEFARNVPYRDALRDLTCNAVSAKSHGNPFVRAWAEHENGTLEGRVAEWPAKSCNEVPSWYWAQSLGFILEKRSHALNLRLELRDQNELLGSLNVPLKDLPTHEAVVRDLSVNRQSNTSRSCRVSFQILDSNSVTDKRTVYFVRHAESEWNKAQSKLDLNGMARTTDHPLSLKGRQQAEALSKKLAEAAEIEPRDPAVEQLYQPDVVYASPLTRAVQTAVIALGPMLTKLGGERELLLMASSREKLNFGGFDTWSTKKGADIVRSTLGGLRELYKGEEEQSEALKAFELMRFETQEVQGRWWCEGVSEPTSQLEARLQEFMSQLMYSPHRTIVVVGHSQFFRAVFKGFLAKEFKEGPDSKLARDFAQKKLDNCSVARLELDPSRGLAGGPVVSAELVLGSDFVNEEQGMLSCCSAEMAPKGAAGPPGEARIDVDANEKYQVADPATGTASAEMGEQDAKASEDAAPAQQPEAKPAEQGVEAAATAAAA